MCEPEIAHIRRLSGPIGSKKPASNWSPIPYNTNGRGSIFNMNFAEGTAAFMDSNPSSADFAGETNGLEDSLPLDPEDLWEDQHAVMQLMHQQDDTYQLPWKTGSGESKKRQVDGKNF